MLKLTSQLSGLKQLDDALRELPVRVARNQVQKALSAGGAIFQEEARLRAPKGKEPAHPKYGRLARQIKVTVLRRARKWRVVVHNGNAFWGVWIERGRSAFTVKKRRVLSDGKVIFGRKVKATPARPFFRPAFDAKKQAAALRVREKLLEGVLQEAEKLGRAAR